MLRPGDIVVAKTTIQTKSVLTGVPGMIEWHGLLGLVANTQILGSGVIGDAGGNGSHKKKEANNYLEWSPVGTSWKDISHGLAEKSHKVKKVYTQRAIPSIGKPLIFTFT